MQNGSVVIDSVDVATLTASECPRATSRHCSRKLGILIPTCNAAAHWPNLHQALQQQGIPPQQVLIIDSSSTDGTPTLARNHGYTVVQIRREEFGHGRTRQLACGFLPDAELLLFLTQDAVLDQPDSVARLCAALDNPEVGAAFGRQLPRPEANAIERHARLFNYPDESSVRCFDNRTQFGIKTAFFSNSYGLYRRTALEAVGGFPEHVISGEDIYVAAKLLMAGWKIAYEANATAVHSHDLSLRQEFTRYFDTGVHHGRERWLLKTFGTAGGEGRRFVQSELHYLRECRATYLIPAALLRTGLKLLAYRLGQTERLLAPSLRTLLSSNRGFWRQDAELSQQFMKSFGSSSASFSGKVHSEDEKPANASL